jgi:hypothetical protein
LYINKLKQELQDVKAREERLGKDRRVAERNKQYDMEFEKELFWGGSKNHMI